MVINPNRQIEKLKAENERLKEKIKNLETQNTELKKALDACEERVQTEVERAQKILIDGANIEKQFKEAIEAARLSKNRYDEFLKNAVIRSGNKNR